ncbi:hypothetical protein [uncultured Paraglaciecola sp.]|uniref:hypothetical protein n=1 Tax=uncultured Paraglaciecola sp. TaxID=1765024 RepID=UPI0026201B5A|nr:hypothetical protein [uncultured Paraglaciecola sp.]
MPSSFCPTADFKSIDVAAAATCTPFAPTATVASPADANSAASSALDTLACASVSLLVIHCRKSFSTPAPSSISANASSNGSNAVAPTIASALSILAPPDSNPFPAHPAADSPFVMVR